MSKRSSALVMVLPVLGVMLFFTLFIVAFLKARSAEREVARLARLLDKNSEEYLGSSVDKSEMGEIGKNMAGLMARIGKGEEVLNLQQKALGEMSEALVGFQKGGEGIWEGGGGEFGHGKRREVLMEALRELLRDPSIQDDIRSLISSRATPTTSSRPSPPPSMEDEMDIGSEVNPEDMKQKVSDFREKKREIMERVRNQEMSMEEAKEILRESMEQIRGSGGSMRGRGRRMGGRGGF